MVASLSERGNFFSVPPVKVFWSFYPGSEYCKGVVKTGYAVPKKNWKRAVDRNRIKRQMREAVRKNIQVMMDTAFERGFCIDAVFMWTGREMLPFQQVENKIILSLQRLQKELENKINIPGKG